MKWKKAIRKIAMQKYVDDMKLFLKEKFPQNYGTKEDLKLNTKHLSPRGKSSASLNELAPLIISQDNQYTPKYEAFDFTEDHGLRTKVSAGDSSKRTPKGLKAIKSREEDDLVVISLSSRNQAFTTPKALPPLHPATRRTVEKILDTDQCIHGDEEDSIDHVHLRKVDKIAAFKSLNPFSTDCIFPTKAVPDAQRKLLDEINQGLPQLDVMSACSYLRSTVASQSHAHLKTKKKLKRKKKVHNDTNDIVSVPSLEQCIGNEEHVALMYSINPVKYRTVAEMLDPVEPCLSIDSSDNKASSDEDFSVLGNSVDGDSGKFNGVNLPKIAKKNRNDWFENSAQPLFVKISSSNEKEKKEKTIGNGTISSSGKYKPYVVRDTKKTLEKMKKLGAYT